jgi:hypothetical protein
MKAIAKPVDMFAGMNGTERDFAVLLEAKKRNGSILSWRFEPVTLRLAPGSGYTPDFMIVACDGTIDFAEVKGFWREAARVRLKVAADLFREFSFIAYRKLAKKDGGGWTTEPFAP